MKKLIVLTMVMALFIGIPMCVFAQGDPRGASWCSNYATAYPEDFALYYRNLGECVSYMEVCLTPKNDPAVCSCMYMRMRWSGPYEDKFETQGLGPCVHLYRELH